MTEARVRGEVVWRSRSAYLARHRDGDGHDSHGHGCPPRAVAPDIPRPLPVSAERRLPAHLGRRYGVVSGDRDPVHLQPLTAPPFGFPRTIAHGVWTFACCVAEA
ncbi:MaoC/PaaZ C-terminal domain-containing protein [Streptomyces scopuliridis]